MENTKSVLLIAPADRKFRVSFRREDNKSDLESIKEKFEVICQKDFALRQILDCSESHFIFQKYDDLFKCEVEITEADEIDHGSILQVTIFSAADPTLALSKKDQRSPQKSDEVVVLNSSNPVEHFEPSQAGLPKKSFFIVQFLDSREKDVVPKDWLNKDITMCSYPIYRSAIKLSEAVKNAEEVGRSWKVRPVKGIKEFETYELASKSLHGFDQIGSEEQSVASEKPQKRPSVEAVIQNHDEIMIEAVKGGDVSKSFKDESSPNQEEYVVMDLLSLCESDGSVWLTNSSQSSLGNVTENRQTDLSNLAEELGMCCESCKRTSFGPLLELKRKIQHNTDLINELCALRGIGPNTSFQRTVSSPVRICPPPQSLPLSSFEDIRAFNEYLQDPDNFSSSVAYFSTYSADNTNHTVNMIMRELIHGGTAVSYNWLGRGSKKPFKEMTRICQLIFYATKSNPRCCDASLSEVYHHIKNWLRFAISRSDFRPKKRNRKSVQSSKNQEVQVFSRTECELHSKTISLTQTSKDLEKAPSFSSNTTPPIKECNIRVQKIELID